MKELNQGLSILPLHGSQIVVVVAARHRINVAAHDAHAQVRVLLLQRLDLEPAVVPRVVPCGTGKSTFAGPSPSTPPQPGGHSFQTLADRPELPGGCSYSTSVSPPPSTLPTALARGGPRLWSLDWTPGHNGLQPDTPFLAFAPNTSEMHSAVASSRRGPSLPARKTT